MRFRIALFLPVPIACLLTVVGFAARQNQQRVHLDIAIPRTPQLKLVLPTTTRISLSALEMSRDTASNVMELAGAAEIRIWLGPSAATVVRADTAVVDLNTGEIQTRGEVSMAIEK
jgi:hypothetical protein